jgi:exonuclease III
VREGGAFDTAVTYRIATWNFLSGGSAKRSTHWQMLHEHVKADLLMTQESGAASAETVQCRSALWTEARKRRWGTGLYATRDDIEPAPVRGFKGWVTGGTIAAPRWLTSHTVKAFSVHCPAGNGGYTGTMHRLIDRLRPTARKCDLVLAGDFNVVVGFRGPDEAVRMSKQEREVLTRVRDELGLVPCWQTANPDRPLAQTLRWTGNRAAPYHCDGIFIPASWSRHLVSCDVVSGPAWDSLSDHNPVVAVLGEQTA